MMRENVSYRLQLYLQFLSLYKGKKSQNDFLIKNETETHQIC